MCCGVLTAWRATSRPSPACRHFVTVVVLASVPLVVLLTAVGTHASLLVAAREEAAAALEAHSSSPLNAVDTAFTHVVAVTRLLVAAWALGFVARVARLALAYRRVRVLQSGSKIRHSGLATRVEQLCVRTGTTARPLVLHLNNGRTKGSVDGPFVTGVRRSLLFIPALDLSPDHWDAVVLRELAHIRRRDCLTDCLIQSVSAVFWFHPAVRILRRWAMDAREECCDEEATRLVPPLALARGIVRIASNRADRALMMGAASGALVHRVTRLLPFQSHESAAGRVWTPLVGASLVAATSISLALRIAPAIDPLVIGGTLAHAFPSQQIIIRGADPAGRFELSLMNGRVARVAVGGKPVDAGSVTVSRGELTVQTGTGEGRLSLHFDPRGTTAWHARLPRRATTAGGR